MEYNIPFKVCPKCGSDKLEKFNELGEGEGIDEYQEGEFYEEKQEES